MFLLAGKVSSSSFCFIFFFLSLIVDTEFGTEASDSLKSFTLDFLNF